MQPGENEEMKVKIKTFQIIGDPSLRTCTLSFYPQGGANNEAEPTKTCKASRSDKQKPLG